MGMAVPYGVKGSVQTLHLSWNTPHVLLSIVNVNDTCTTNASGVGVGVRRDDDEHLHPFLPSGRMRHGPNHDIVVQYEGLLTYHSTTSVKQVSSHRGEGEGGSWQQ